ncbi:hypothetical protein Tcan_01433, partial [Toxocara canis]
MIFFLIDRISEKVRNALSRNGTCAVLLHPDIRPLVTNLVSDTNQHKYVVRLLLPLRKILFILFALQRVFEILWFHKWFLSMRKLIAIHLPKTLAAKRRSKDTCGFRQSKSAKFLIADRKKAPLTDGCICGLFFSEEQKWALDCDS